MGFLDSIKKIMDAAEKIADLASDSGKGSGTGKPPERAPQPDTSLAEGLAEIMKSGDIPAKASVSVNEEYGDKQYSFRLSGDFIEFNSHCEMDPAYQYEPYSKETYTEYKSKVPQIFIGPYDEVYDAVEKYLENGAPYGRDFEKLENEYFLFRCRTDYFGEILYCYAFSDGTAREREIFGLTYNRAIQGTALEKKLTAALDEAAMSYREETVK